MNVIYEDQVLFVRIKLLYAEIEPVSNSNFYGAIVSNTQYLSFGGLIYSDNTNFYCIS